MKMFDFRVLIIRVDDKVNNIREEFVDFHSLRLMTGRDISETIDPGSEGHIRRLSVFMTTVRGLLTRRLSNQLRIEVAALQGLRDKINALEPSDDG